MRAVFVRVMHTIRGATKRVLRACFALCTANLETARSAGFMVILAVAKRSAGTHSLYQSSLFKGLFLTLIRTVQQYTARVMPKVGFLLNAMVELYGTDLEAAYQHAFVYIRQLAVYLRAALQDPSQASNLRTVCNWQYLIALRTWAFVVSTYHETKQLGPLIHPVVQIALGVIDVFASPRMIPLHLHVVETLNHVAARAKIFIPVAPYLMRVLTSPSHALTSSLGQGADKKGGGAASAAAAAGKKQGGGGGNNSKNNNRGGDAAADAQTHSAKSDSSFTDLQFMLRVKKAYARSADYVLNVWLEAVYLLTEHLSHMSHFISFPEATWQVLTSINKLKRDVKVPKIHALLSNIARNIEATQTFVLQKRNKVAFGPCDVQQVKMFEDALASQGTPLSAYYSKVRAARMADFAAKQKLIVNSDNGGDKSSKKDGKDKKQKSEAERRGRRVDDESRFHDDDVDLDDAEVVDDGKEEEEISAIAKATNSKMSGARRRRG